MLIHRDFGAAISWKSETLKNGGDVTRTCELVLQGFLIGKGRFPVVAKAVRGSEREMVLDDGGKRDVAEHVGFVDRCLRVVEACSDGQGVGDLVLGAHRKNPLV